MTRNEVDRRVFASSIDFEIELQLIAFVQFAQARPFHSTDVDECVGLAVVTRDEAEAFHRVEELDRTGSLFTGQFALRRCRAGFNRDNVAHNLKVSGGDLSATIDKVEFELLTFGKAFEAGAFHSADVNEHIFAAVFTLNEAEALLAVEELYGAFAGTHDLGRHAAAATTRAAAEAATTTRAAAEAATAATRAAAEAAAIAATETTAITAAEAAAIAKATTATAEVVTAAAETAVGIEIVFAETVPLVASASPPPSVKTHINQ